MDAKARDKAEKLIRLSASNHQNEADMAARNACKIIRENGFSLHEPAPTRSAPQVVREVVRQVVRVPDPESYDRGYRTGYSEGTKQLPPVPEVDIEKERAAYMEAAQADSRKKMRVVMELMALLREEDKYT